MQFSTATITRLLGQLDEAAASPECWPAFLKDLQSVSGTDVVNVDLPRQRSFSHEQRIGRWVAGGNVFNNEQAKPEGVPGAETKNLLAMLAPHLRRALSLHRSLEENRIERSMLRQSVDTADLAIVSLGSDGETLHATRSAREILATADGLILRGKHLRAMVCGEQQQFCALLREASPGPGGVGREGAMLISRREPKRPLQVVVTPFCFLDGSPETQPSVLVFLCDPDAVPASRASILRKLYGLSPTECRLADHLAAGVELQSAAERLRLTVQTARFHLKAIFRKTETNRQTDLVRLILGLPGVSHS
jgi:DNA-binding CsgD family transcriptional regulator